MKKCLKILILASLLAVILPPSAHSQELRPEAEGENMVISAVSALNAGDTQKARKVLTALLSVDAENDAAWYYLSQICLEEGDLSEAEESLKKAVALDPDNFWYRYRLARLYMATQCQELTISMYEELLEDFPKKSDLYFEMVELYAAQGEYDKALDTMAEIETVFGMTESIAVYRFNLLRALKRTEEAYQSLERYNKEYSSPFVLTALADHRMETYSDSTALAYYNEALSLAPDYAPALLGKAEALRISRKYDEYFDALDRYMTVSSSPVEAKSEYLMALVRQTDPRFIRSFLPQIDSVVSNVLQMHPKDSTMLQTAAIYYYTTDRRDKSGECFRRNIEAWPESLSASAAYVEFLMYAEDWETLSKEGREAYARFPQETSFLEMASVGDYNLKEYDKVLDICDKVIEAAPKDSSKTLRAWSTIGDIHHLKGDSKKAYRAYEKALKINPDYLYVLNNYAYYLSLEGKKLKKAYNMSRKTIEAEPDNPTYLDTFGWILYLQGKALEAKPFFKHAMLYGGKDSAVMLDHYAEVLYALKEYDMAFVYWNLAKQKDKDGELPDLDMKIEERKKAIDR